MSDGGAAAGVGGWAGGGPAAKVAAVKASVDKAAVAMTGSHTDAVIQLSALVRLPPCTH